MVQRKCPGKGINVPLPLPAFLRKGALIDRQSLSIPLRGRALCEAWPTPGEINNTLYGTGRGGDTSWQYSTVP